MKKPSLTVLRPPAELLYADELATLAKADKDPRPAGWKLSAKAVKAFIIGQAKPLITRKYYGNDILVERAIISLASNRGLLLAGDPGTAKSLLSELLAAAISGTSTLTIQGSAGTTEDQVRYAWNYALLLAKGPVPEALVPGPVYRGMQEGKIVRFEEVTRCPAEIQDTLISILSEKLLMVPELSEAESVVMAQPGFNIIATANTRDRGVHEMSSALKRRFNFETVLPIQDAEAETKLVTQECAKLLAQSNATVEIPLDVIKALVTAFQELREGKTQQGAPIERTSGVMSTAEAVSVAFTAGLDAFYFGDKNLTAATVVRHLASAALKDQPDDLKKLRNYFDSVVRKRAEEGQPIWVDFYEARKHLR